MEVSQIAEIDASNKNITKVIVFDKSMNDSDIKLLSDEFDYDMGMIDKSTKIYRNVALVMDLVKKEENFSAGWGLFLEKYFPKRESSKLDNVFYNKSYNKLLLIKNKRLVTIDVKKINKKNIRINNDIE